MSRSILLPRRSFLTGLGAMLAAPAIVKANALMPVSNIDHILYPVRGLIYYNAMTDHLEIRADRSNRPMNMTPKGIWVLTDREINAVFTKEQLKSLIPATNETFQQKCISIPFDSAEWMKKKLFIA